MATDFSKLMYKTVEEQLLSQVGERRKELTKEQWRVLMDKAMEQFAWALIAVVANFTANLKEAADKAKAEKAAAEAAAAPAPAVPPMSPDEAYGGTTKEAASDIPPAA